MSVGRTFFATLVLSLCLLGLVLAVFLINYNIRTTIHGQVEFSLSYTMEAGVPVLTDQGGTPLWSPPAGAQVLIDAPTRLLTALYRWLSEQIL